jgi:ribosomal protein S18 acetylase RimI-like enzyme
MLVTKSLRGQGIGSTLFALRLLSAQEKGIEVVFGTVAPDNFDSLRLFLKHGFQEIERRQIFDFTSLRILIDISEK